MDAGTHHSLSSSSKLEQAIEVADWEIFDGIAGLADDRKEAADAAISEYVGMVSTRGSKVLVERARTIGSEAQRDAAMLLALQGWVGREGEAAVEAIGELDLPDAVREQFTSIAESERWWREQGK